jgi:hypothetical protein
LLLHTANVSPVPRLAYSWPPLPTSQHALRCHCVTQQH